MADLLMVLILNASNVGNKLAWNHSIDTKIAADNIYVTDIILMKKFANTIKNDIGTIKPRFQFNEKPVVWPIQNIIESSRQRRISVIIRGIERELSLKLVNTISS